MRFMMLYRPADSSSSEAGVPPSAEHMAEMGRLIDEMSRAGVLLATDGLQGSAKGALVRRSRGETTVIDGPFRENGRLIEGYAIVDTESKATAIELAERFLRVAGDGETEIRLMHDPPALVR